VTGLVINITCPGFGTDSAQEPSGTEFVAFSYLLTKKKETSCQKVLVLENNFFISSISV